MTIGKPFDPILHGVCDQRAKEASIRFLRQYLKIEPVLNKDTYGVDIVAGRYHFEPEVKTGWVGNNFPFRSLHIPYRKVKYVDPGTYFLIWNRDLTAVAIVSWLTIRKQARLIEKDTTFTEKEYFFEIPISKVIFKVVA